MEAPATEGAAAQAEPAEPGGTEHDRPAARAPAPRQPAAPPSAEDRAAQGHAEHDRTAQDRAAGERTAASHPAEAGATSDAQALQDFIGKWRARWPEWALAEAFVPRPQRETALAWAALQQELADAAWGGSDPLPGEAKLGWWAEELRAWPQGRRRHPLGQALQRLPAPWEALAAALPALRESRERAADPADARRTLAPLTAAVAAIDLALFGPADAAAPAGPLPGQDRAAQDRAGQGMDAIAAGLLQAQLAHLGEAAAPLSLLARAAAEPGQGAAGHWRQALLADWPARGGATRPRRLWTALARARLGRGEDAGPLPPWTALLTAWRGARN